MLTGPVTVLGASSLLGRHLVETLQNRCPDVDVRRWMYSRASKNEEVKSNMFIGMSQLEDSIRDAQFVFNCHGAVDLSVTPDKELLNKHNVEFVSRVLSLVSCPLIHVSSTFVQCSSRWPNVFEPERDWRRYVTQWPFQEFCASKARADELIEKADESTSVIIIRVPPLYGENDTSSVLSDAIWSSGLFGAIPNVGDHGGAYQMAYVGNVAEGVLDAAEALLSSKLRNKEVIIIGDNTPTGDVVNNLVVPIVKGSKNSLSAYNLPFLPLYYIYLMFCYLLILLNKFLPLESIGQQLPDPNYFYFVCHHWTFFQTNKAALLLKKREEPSREMVIERCRKYYGILDASKIAPCWRGRLA